MIKEQAFGHSIEKHRGLKPENFEDPELRRCARQIAAGLVSRARFQYSDREDLEQELLTDLWNRHGSFNPTLSSFRTFAAMVMTRRATSLLKGYRAKKRGWQFRHDALNGHEEVSGAVHFTTLELQIDTDRAISRLPPELAAVARLQGSQTALEVGRMLGISRATVYRRVARIRDIFTERGLARNITRRRNPSPRASTLRIQKAVT